MITTHPRRVGRFGLVELLESRQLLAAAPFTVGAMPELSAGAQWHQYAQLHPIDKPDSVGPDSGGAPQSRAPGLASTIEGITFDENGANNSGLLYIPSNPSGAAGPSHVVSVTNESIEWHTSGGTQQNSQSLKSFFNVLSPATGLFDARDLRLLQ